MTFYYIAKRKPRGRSLQYAGDGLIEAKNMTEAKRIIARSKHCSVKNVFVEPYTYRPGV